MELWQVLFVVGLALLHEIVQSLVHMALAPECDAYEDPDYR